MTQKRLIAISNRTAFGTQSKAGGLAVAVWDALCATNGLWMGWSGKIYDFPSKGFKSKTQDGVDFALCDYSKPEFEGFYLGYTNSVLWPILHGRIDLAHFEGNDFALYDRINARFAQGVMAQAKPDNDIVWVHDYHFMRVARHMRDAGADMPIGFFLHVPFPGPDAFRSIPDHRALADGLIAYDVIGLQSRRDISNLKLYLRQEFSAEDLGGDMMSVEGRKITILHCPIGIDVASFCETAKRDTAREAGERLTKFIGQRSLIIGVDRMDYSKGLPQRFEGLTRFFDDNPDYHGKVSFTQIAPPSRELVDEYIALRKRLDTLAGKINGDYGDLDWIPVRYLARGYAREEIAGLYRSAQICLVTPLQDGMNLVAKEFIAAQDPDDPGVLILSQFAGAAEQMTEALIINPHDPGDIAAAILTALTMPLDERKRRYAALYDGICAQDIKWWRERFLDVLTA